MKKKAERIINYQDHSSHVMHQKFYIFSVDVLSLALSILLVLVMRIHLGDAFFGGKYSSYLSLADFFIIYPYVLIFWSLLGRYYGIYSLYQKRLDEIVNVTKCIFSISIVFSLVAYYTKIPISSRLAIILFVPTAIFMTALFRNMFKIVRKKIFNFSFVQRRILIYNGGKLGLHLLRAINNEVSFYHVIGFIDDSANKDGRVELSGVPVLGGAADLEKVIKKNYIDEVIIAVGREHNNDTKKIIHECLRLNVLWSLVPDSIGIDLVDITTHQIGTIVLLGQKDSNIQGLNLFLKTTVDYVSAILLLIFVSPFMILIAAAIRFSSKGQVIYAADKVGKNMKTFRMYKFRTMYADADEKVHRDYLEEQIIKKGADEEIEIHKIQNDPRITPFGRILRRFSLDELPQLFNVIKGDMSLIGPRPAFSYEITLQNNRQKERCRVKPGITGLWQVSGRNRLTYNEMIDLDIEYSHNWSPGLDIKIFLRTFYAIIIGYCR